MLSNTSKYAIRAVIYLTVNITENNRIGIKKISEDLDIPSPFLGKILQVLVRKKLLSSTKGPNGGFGLGKDPATITLYQIIVEMDGDDLFNSCLLGAGRCKDKSEDIGYCAVHADFEKVRSQMIELYKTRTVAELARQAQESENSIVL